MGGIVLQWSWNHKKDPVLLALIILSPGYGTNGFPPCTPGASPLGLTGVVGGVNAEAGLSTAGAKGIL
jgi:hypothetical protein